MSKRKRNPHIPLHHNVRARRHWDQGLFKELGSALKVLIIFQIDYRCEKVSGSEPPPQDSYQDGFWWTKVSYQWLADHDLDGYGKSGIKKAMRELEDAGYLISKSRTLPSGMNGAKIWRVNRELIDPILQRPWDMDDVFEDDPDDIEIGDDPGGVLSDPPSESGGVLSDPCGVLSDPSGLGVLSDTKVIIQEDNGKDVYTAHSVAPSVSPSPKEEKPASPYNRDTASSANVKVASETDPGEELTYSMLAHCVMRMTHSSSLLKDHNDQLNKVITIIEQGRRVEIGSPADLYDNDGYYPMFIERAIEYRINNTKNGRISRADAVNTVIRRTKADDYNGWRPWLERAKKDPNTRPVATKSSANDIGGAYFPD